MPNRNIVDFRWERQRRYPEPTSSALADLALRKCEEMFAERNWDEFAYWHRAYVHERSRLTVCRPTESAHAAKVLKSISSPTATDYQPFLRRTISTRLELIRLDSLDCTHQTFKDCRASWRDATVSKQLSAVTSESKERWRSVLQRFFVAVFWAVLVGLLMAGGAFLFDIPGSNSPWIGVLGGLGAAVFVLFFA
ncbi:MAG TPA: hypothetical protein VGU20_19110 [Stellaceae bacterium]|nr:hypothetical protein [Stellaceae bacterium]